MMLTVNISGLESTHNVELKQIDISYNTIINIILDIMEKYQNDKKYTKKMCKNNLALTFLGFRKFNPELYYKVPLISVRSTNHFIRGLMFEVNEYVYVKKDIYITVVTEEFKNTLRKVLNVLSEINDSKGLREDFRYTCKSLKMLLDDNVNIIIT